MKGERENDEIGNTSERKHETRRMRGMRETEKEEYKVGEKDERRGRMAHERDKVA